MNIMHRLRETFLSNRLTSLILTIFIFLIPLFFIPGSTVALDYGKNMLAIVAVTVALIIYTLRVLKRGTFDVPSSFVFWGLGLLLAIYFASSVFAISPRLSFFGYGFETTTFFVLLTGVVLSLVTSLSFTNIRLVLLAYAAFFCSVGILALLHITRFIFGSGVLGTFFSSDLLFSPVGKWGDLGIIFALLLILSILVSHSLPLRKVWKIICYALMLLSFVLLVIVNVPLVWYTLGSFSLILFLHSAFVHSSVSVVVKVDEEETESSQSTSTKSGRKISIFALLLAVVSVSFILPIGNFFSGQVYKLVPISSIEVRPSWDGTLDIAKRSIRDNPVLGSGPNSFQYNWQLYKPAINETNFWNINFDSGVGYIPTTLITGGLTSFAAWLLLIIALVYAGIRSLFTNISDPFWRFAVHGSFIAAAFLLVFHVIYTPGPVLFYLMFLFIGLFYSSLSGAGLVRTFSFSFSRFPRVSFIFVLLFVALIISMLSFSYVISKNVISAVYFQSGINAVNAGDVEDGERLILKAIDISPNDIYYRAYSNLNVLRMKATIASVANTEEVSEEMRLHFQTLLVDALTAYQSAVAFNDSNFENHAVGFSIYQTLTPFGVPQAYESALSAHAEATRLSPYNPALPLQMAELEMSVGETEVAREYVEKSLSLKSNYADAIFFLSQIEASEGNIEAAIDSVEKIAFISPNSSAVHFRLGLLEYESGDYEGAIVAFERAVGLEPVYANARYFLGISYYLVGNREAAIRQFEQVEITNPDSEEVKVILKNLREGKDPFSEGETSEDISELPLEENI